MPRPSLQSQQTHLAEVPLASGATLTIERRGPVALFGINRPHIQNRIDPETYRALAKAYHDYDHDPSRRQPFSSVTASASRRGSMSTRSKHS